MINNLFEKSLCVALSRTTSKLKIPHYKEILLKYKTFQNFFESPDEFIKKLYPNDNQLLNKIKKIPENESIKKIKDEIMEAEKNNIKILFYCDNEYPQALNSLKNPPIFITIIGNLLPEDKQAVSVIGTRDPSLYGHKMAFLIGKSLAEAGFTLINGIARGIDTSAIFGALMGNGRVIGILGSGILKFYPRENEELSRDIIKNGAIISEALPNDPVMKYRLQHRNRLSSGLSIANVFVEGSNTSGTLWQYKFSKIQKKINFAVVPLEKDRKMSYIPKLILENRGIPIENPYDLINRLKNLNLTIKPNEITLNEFI